MLEYKEMKIKATKILNFSFIILYSVHINWRHGQIKKETHQQQTCCITKDSENESSQFLRTFGPCDLGTSSSEKENC